MSHGVTRFNTCYQEEMYIMYYCITGTLDSACRVAIDEQVEAWASSIRILNLYQFTCYRHVRQFSWWQCNLVT